MGVRGPKSKIEEQRFVEGSRRNNGQKICFCLGELMAKKWRDSIEKQRRRIDLKERYRHTYIHTDRVNDKK